MSTIPKSFECPITLTQMTNPYVDKEGNTFEKDAIFEWIMLYGNSPITRSSMTINDLHPNRALKDLIDDFMKPPATLAPPVAPVVDTSMTLAGIPRKPIKIIIIGDVSGSMSEYADVSKTEQTYITRLGLMQHLIRAFLESLAPSDMMSLIKFSSHAEILSDLLPMNEKNKLLLNGCVDSMKAGGNTNIWDALRLAIHVASNHSKSYPTDKIHIMLFTDGLSNENPPSGIIPTLVNHLSRHQDLNITLNTFGFSNSVQSKLLYDISELKNGLFGFIPDATMLGTVLINSISYLMDDNKITLPELDQIVLNKFIELISEKKLSEFVEFVSDKLSSDFIKDLYSDCCKSDNKTDGQIEKAIRDQYYNTWGQHYILSVLSAYKNKFCLNFKDKGVQHFKTLDFSNYQKLIEEIFINMPPPKSENRYGSSSQNTQPINWQQFSQVFYNPSSTICILENTLVRVFQDEMEQYIPVQHIRKNTCIISGNMSAFVKCVIKTKHSGPICKKIINNNINIGITPYHPIYINGEWIFPNDSTEFIQENVENVYVYNFFLQDGPPEIELYAGGASENIHAITLNHGKQGPVIGHNYFGTNCVEDDFKKHPDWESGYIQIENIKAIRDPNTNQVIGLEF
jgi:hypothetical protein